MLGDVYESHASLLDNGFCYVKTISDKRNVYIYNYTGSKENLEQRLEALNSEKRLIIEENRQVKAMEG